MDSIQDITQRAAHMEVADKNVILCNPLHPSFIERLDPRFVQLYDEHIANAPPTSKTLSSLRQNYSARYSYATAAPTGVGGKHLPHLCPMSASRNLFRQMFSVPMSYIDESDHD